MLEYADSALGQRAKPVHSLISMLVRARRGNCPRTLTPPARRELIRALQWPFVSLSFAPTTVPIVYAFTDASDQGWALALIFQHFSLVVRDNWSSQPAPITPNRTNAPLLHRFINSATHRQGMANAHINLKELYPIFLASLLLNQFFKDHFLVSVGDSRVIQGCLIRRYSPSPQLHSALTCFPHLKALWPFWLSTKRNPVDLASREIVDLSIVERQCRSFVCKAPWMVMGDVGSLLAGGVASGPLPITN